MTKAMKSALLFAALTHLIQKGTPKTLDKRDCARPCRGFGVTGFAGQVRGNGVVDDAQHLTHDGRLAGKQKAQWKRYSEHPLTHGLMR